MSIKLLATDLDGTLVADLHTISDRTQQAIKAAAVQGVIVTIATGREYPITHKFVEMLELTSPVICYQGAATYDSQTGKAIAGDRLDMAATYQLIDVARSLDVALSLHFSTNAYAEKLTPQGKDFFTNIGTAMTEVDDLKQHITKSPIKAMVFHPPGQGEKIATELRAHLNGTLKVFRSLEYLIEITDPNVSKGRALAALADYYGIKQDEVMAMGDQDNDVEMIAWAGTGVAMGDASPKAKAAANHIAPTLAEEGAAWAIEHFILEQR